MGFKARRKSVAQQKPIAAGMFFQSGLTGIIYELIKSPDGLHVMEYNTRTIHAKEPIAKTTMISTFESDCQCVYVPPEEIEIYKEGQE